MAHDLTAKSLSFTQMVQTESVQKTIQSVLGDPKRAMKFTASIVTAVSVNPALKECEPHSVLSAALLGEALELSPSPQLGQFYMVPFEDKKLSKERGRKVMNASFILGFKGYLQLAIRSGQFKHITAIEIKEGELKSFDPMHDRIDCVVITDPIKRNLAKTIGYYGYFDLVNGFEKAIYMPIGEMEQHADTYSKAFSLKTYRQIQQGKIAEDQLWKYSSFWYKDFDTMAKKTIIRKMLSSGYAPLSVEMARALEADDKLVDAHEDGTQDFSEIMEEAKDVSPATEVEQQPETDLFDAIEQSGGQLDFEGL